MCLIIFAYKVDPNYDLLLMANRDEYCDRKFTTAHRWGDSKQVISGIDLTANGGWTGVSQAGRIAAITNFRSGYDFDQQLKSRGELVRNFLDSDIAPQEFLATIRKSKSEFNGYNLLFGDQRELYWYSNQTDQFQLITPGIYGICNHLLDTPWPKLVDAKAQLHQMINCGNVTPDHLLSIMLNKSKYPLDQLPKTGIDIDIEQGLSSIFVDLEKYGSVLTSLIYMNNKALGFYEYKHLDNKGSIKQCFSSKAFALNVE